MPGLFRCDRGDYTRVLPTHCTRGCGCIGHPAFPAPSVFSRVVRTTTRAFRAARMRTHVLNTSQLSSPASGRSSSPETSVIEPKSRGVLDTPPSWGMTAHENRYALKLPHQIRRDLADAADAHQREVAVDLVAQQRDRALDARLAAGDRRIEKRPADKDEVGAERQRLDDVGAAPDAAV